MSLHSNSSRSNNRTTATEDRLNTGSHARAIAKRSGPGDPSGHVFLLATIHAHLRNAVPTQPALRCPWLEYVSQKRHPVRFTAAATVSSAGANAGVCLCPRCPCGVRDSDLPVSLREAFPTMMLRSDYPVLSSASIQSRPTSLRASAERCNDDVAEGGSASHRALFRPTIAPCLLCTRRRVLC